jgi:D-xylose transport system ATP-binding protein
VTDNSPDQVGRPVILRATGIVKAFGSVVALNGVDLEVCENEIVGLVGDNGAGKSTLIKILSGNFPADRGEIELDGQAVRFHSPADARAAGIETVYQDLSLCPNLDSTANLFIGRELIRNVLGIKVLRKFLSGGQRQAVSLARFVAWGQRLILLDEPTAALGVRETGKALDLIAGLHRDKRISMVFISHNLQHVFRIADRIVVLRHGEVAGARMTAETTPDEIVSLITGAALMVNGAA